MKAVNLESLPQINGFVEKIVIHSLINLVHYLSIQTSIYKKSTKEK